MKTTLLFGILILNAVGTFAAGNSVNLIKNGSFEFPADVPPNSILRTPPDEWAAGGTFVQIIDGDLSPGYPLPHDGQQYLSLGVGASVSQTFTIVSAGDYTLTWFDSTEFNGPDQTSPYSVTIIRSDGVTVMEGVFDANADDLRVWRKRPIPLTLDPGEYTVHLISFSPLFAETSLIDNVSIMAPAPTVAFINPPTRVLPSVLPRAKYDLSIRETPEILTVEVRENGLPKSEVSVTIRLRSDNTDDSGHLHGPKPHGWLYRVDAEMPVQMEGLGGSFEDNPLFLLTDSNGQARFNWLPPEIAGTDLLSAEISNFDVTRAEIAIETKVSGLQQLPLDPSYLLIGERPSHLENHFGTQFTIDSITGAADLYIFKQLNDPEFTAVVDVIQKRSKTGYTFPIDILRVNDVSLPFGGLFDHQANWVPPHGGHRWGTQVDFQTKHLVKNPKLRLKHNNAAGDSNAPKNVQQLVRLAQLLQFELMNDALREAGGSLLAEDNPPHLHVSFAE